MSGEEGASPRLIVTSCRVSSGRVAAAVDSGGTVVLVSQDGIQRPPFRFPKGGHLLQLLSCLENGLLPHGQLDPPLWSQRGKVSDRGGPGRQGWGSAVGGPSCLWALVWLRGLMHAPQGPSGCAGCGTGVSQGPGFGVCSFRAKYSPNCASEAPRVHPSPRLQTRKTTRPQITCSGSSTLACSPNLVSCPGPRPGESICLAGPEIDFSYVGPEDKRCEFWG